MAAELELARPPDAFLACVVDTPEDEMYSKHGDLKVLLSDGRVVAASKVSVVCDTLHFDVMFGSGMRESEKVDGFHEIRPGHDTPGGAHGIIAYFKTVGRRGFSHSGADLGTATLLDLLAYAEFVESKSVAEIEAAAAASLTGESAPDDITAAMMSGSTVLQKRCTDLMWSTRISNDTAQKLPLCVREPLVKNAIRKVKVFRYIDGPKRCYISASEAIKYLHYFAPYVDVC